MFDDALLARAKYLLALYRAKGVMLATAESCTGGLVAGTLTEIAGSSDVVERGFVTYSNMAKSQMLSVPPDLILTHGAVSAPVARAMAAGAISNSGADVSVAITGVAGPGGGSEQKPVGLVWFGLSIRGGDTMTREMRYGDLGRGGVRRAAINTAFDMLEEGLKSID